METLRTSNVLKFISYILFPIFVLCIGLSIFHLAFLDEYGNTESNRFIDTEMFSSNYIYYITDNMENAYHHLGIPYSAPMTSPIRKHATETIDATRGVTSNKIASIYSTPFKVIC